MRDHARIAAERDRATAEAARASAINDFLREMLTAADPWEGEGRDVTIREALKRYFADRVKGSYIPHFTDLRPAAKK